MSKTIWPAVEAALATLPRATLERIAAADGVQLPADARLAATLLTRARHHPTHVLDELTKDEWHQLATEVGVAGRAAWDRANPPDMSLPEYRRDCWEDAIYEAVWPEPPPPAGPRDGTERNPAHAGSWAELASLEAWSALDEPRRGLIIDAIAESLGAGFQRQGAKLRHASGLLLVPIPGGEYDLGLGRTEARELRKVAKARGPEAAELAGEYPRQARPVRKVCVPPFLCASAPADRAQLAVLAGAALSPGELDDANPHGIALISARLAAEVRGETLRLLSEAEWEWVARAGGARSWLCGKVVPEVWIQAAASSALQEDGHPWGVHGQAWGSWVEDGWSATHTKTPLDASPRRPTAIPTTVRGGGLELWPWQDAGEVITLHTSFRDRGGTYHPVLLARDLPRRG